ncbi:MAG: DUF1778 domain-containing protein [Thermodesulfobacteriota bacterium]|nr:DUF1778 domain-containing protein [Thermodesulfobacteriota bacterium]
MSTSATTPKASSPRRKTSAARSGRLGLRTTPIQAALIQRAAEVTQKSITEFVLTSACEKAEQTLLDQRLFLIDEQAWKEFQEVLERPAQVKAGLQTLIEEPAIWEHE